jgi:hypothetical protein
VDGRQVVQTAVLLGGAEGRGGQEPVLAVVPEASEVPPRGCSFPAGAVTNVGVVQIEFYRPRLPFITPAPAAPTITTTTTVSILFSCSVPTLHTSFNAAGRCGQAQQE